MKGRYLLLGSGLAAALTLPLTANATNGYFAHGYGTAMPDPVRHLRDLRGVDHDRAHGAELREVVAPLHGEVVDPELEALLPF